MKNNNESAGEVIVSLSMICGAGVAFGSGMTEPIYSVAGALILIAVCLNDIRRNM